MLGNSFIKKIANERHGFETENITDFFVTMFMYTMHPLKIYGIMVKNVPKFRPYVNVIKLR